MKLIITFIRISYAMGINPLPALRKRFGCCPGHDFRYIHKESWNEKFREDNIVVRLENEDAVLIPKKMRLA